MKLKIHMLVAAVLGNVIAAVLVNTYKKRLQGQGETKVPRALGISD